MELERLVTDIRGLYLEMLEDALQEAGEGADVQIKVEPLLEQDPDVEAEGPLTDGLPSRCDLAVFREGDLESLQNVEADEMFDFEPVEFAWGDDLQIVLLPFSWDSLALLIPGEADRDWDPLRGWFSKWAKPSTEDAKPGELVEACHRISEPFFDGESTLITIDLGSAPVEAFEGLLDALVELDCKEATIGSVDADFASEEAEGDDDGEEGDEGDWEDAEDSDDE
ncbi:MAG: hypothetical protein KDA83_15875 [Planctomycetales bacterium]|nr:hypothetical protein [Planctomycetales bacterium]